MSVSGGLSSYPWAGGFGSASDWVGGGVSFDEWVVVRGWVLGEFVGVCRAKDCDVVFAKGSVCFRGGFIWVSFFGGGCAGKFGCVGDPAFFVDFRVIVLKLC